MHDRLANIFQMRAHDDFFIVNAPEPGSGSGRRPPAMKQLSFSLHVSIRKSHLPHEFHAAYLEPDEMVRMVSHAHLVGFGVTHPQADFIDHRNEFLPPCFTCPLHCGLRFSRNDEMPSRKSCGRADTGILADGGLNLHVEFAAGVIAQQTLGRWSARRDCFPSVVPPVRGRACISLSGGHYFVDQSHAVGFVRVDDSSGQQQIARMFLSDLTQ